MAALLGTSSNVLTFLECSAFFGLDSHPNNVQFYGNVSGWLGGDTPEPATMLLTGSTLMVAFWRARRRRR